MPTGETRPHAAGLRWLCCGALYLCALLVSAQEAGHMPPGNAASTGPQESSAHQAHVQEVRQGLQRLSGQIVQLREASTQTTQAQVGQGDAIRQQLSSVERSQSKLANQLSTLQQHSLQQIEALQVTNGKLTTALWTLAGLASLLVLGMLLAWHWRRACGPADASVHNAPHTHMRQEPGLQTTPIKVEEESEPESSQQAQAPIKYQASEPPATNTTAEPALAEPATTPAPAAPAWVSLLTADLHSTEQALAQARLGFMQPARIDS